MAMRQRWRPQSYSEKAMMLWTRIAWLTLGHFTRAQQAIEDVESAGRAPRHRTRQPVRGRYHPGVCPHPPAAIRRGGNQWARWHTCLMCGARTFFASAVTPQQVGRDLTQDRPRNPPASRARERALAARRNVPQAETVQDLFEGGNAQVDQEWVVADAVRSDVPNSSWVNTIVTQAAQAATQAATEAMTTVLAQALAPIQGAQSLQAGELQRQAQALQALMQTAAGHQPPGGSAVVHLPMNDPDVMHES